jgi:thiosulfate reductase cytochrome b subunit
MLSGWAIYNASRSLPFTFPRWMTLGFLWVIAEYSCAIDVASAFLIQVYGSAPISSRHF